MKKIFTLFLCCVGFNTMAQIKDLTDDSIGEGDTITLSSDTTYLLIEKVFVESGAVLNIQAGTVIKGKEGQGEDATALVICRGARIYANGTKYKPIIFTAESDEFGNLNSSDKGLWGGVVVLGNAVTNDGEDEVEGIAPGDPRSLFGGDDDNDTSGVLRYVSIRHSGVSIAKDNELNGLSLAGVGRGTILEYVESYASSDDGIEWWGGCVNGRYLVCAFCDDDAFDIDQGYRGKLQFIFAIQDSIAEEMSANWAGEWDGDDTKGAEPFANWTISNATFIGGGEEANSSNAGIILRANAGATVYNSVFMNFKKDRGVVIEDLQDKSQDSRKRYEDGEIKFGNNIFWKCGDAEDLESICHWYYKDEDGKSQYPLAEELAEDMDEWDNTYEDPELESIGYSAGSGSLNPRPATDGPAFENMYEFEDDEFFDNTHYKGAFAEDNWADSWSFLSKGGYFSDDFIGVRERYVSPLKASAVTFLANYRNKMLNINYTLPKSGDVSFKLFSLGGKQISSFADGYRKAGTHLLTADLSAIASGTYICNLKSGIQVLNHRITINK